MTSQCSKLCVTTWSHFVKIKDIRDEYVNHTLKIYFKFLRDNNLGLCLPVDACSLDLGPLLCLLWCGWLWLLLPHLPERSWVVLPPAGLEEPDCNTHLEHSAQETGNIFPYHLVWFIYNTVSSRRNIAAEHWVTVWCRGKKKISCFWKNLNTLLYIISYWVLAVNPSFHCKAAIFIFIINMWCIVLRITLQGVPHCLPRSPPPSFFPD